MKKFVCKCLLMILLAGTTVSAAYAQSNSPVGQHGQLRVSGGKIVDKNNDAPQLRGISMSWSIWGGKKYYNTGVINWLKNDFKISLLRLSMAVEPDGGYLKKPEEQTALITKAVDDAIARGIYVIIDWHDHHAHLNEEKSKAFFSAMAKRYSGKPNVIYEIYNEPERIEWSVVKKYSVTLINEIRKYDRQNLIVVGSPSWDQDVDLVAKDPITGVDNVAYSFHFYASDPWHQEKLMEKADMAIRSGLPLIVTEWGVGEATGDGVFDLAKTEKWMKWMEEHKLSWANWNVTDKDETTALLKPGTAVNGQWTNEELTAAGKYIREKLRLLNKY